MEANDALNTLKEAARLYKLLVDKSKKPFYARNPIPL
jgi:hypothetical protein